MANNQPSAKCKADEEVKERDVMKEAEENLASVKSTLAAIDDLNKRWEVKTSNITFILRV